MGLPPLLLALSFYILGLLQRLLHVNNKDEHKERTAFTIPSDHYESNSLPFGLSSFQCLVDVLLKYLVVAECYVFIDDVIIFSNTTEEHALRLENVLHRFDEANL